MSTTPDPDDVHYHLQAAINRLKQAVDHLEVPLVAFNDEWNRLMSVGSTNPHLIALEQRMALAGHARRCMTEARAALEDLAGRL